MDRHETAPANGVPSGRSAYSDGWRGDIDQKAIEIESKANDLLAKFGRAKDELWLDKDSGKLGVRLRTFVVARSWKVIDPSMSKLRMARRIIPLLQAKGMLASRSRGDLAQSPFAAREPGAWTEETLKNYLDDKPNFRPLPHEAEAIYEELVRTLSDMHCRQYDASLDLLEELLPLEHSVIKMSAKILSAARRIGEARWVAPKGFVPFVSPSLSADPQLASPKIFSELAVQALTHLRNPTGRRAVLIAGGAHSGRKSVLRHMLSRVKQREWLDLQDNTSLPILAIAIGDQPPSALIDKIFHFYEAASPNIIDREGRTGDLPTWTKVRHICRLARTTPACLMLADVEPFEDDELVRNFHGAEISQVILGVLHSHHLTRIVFTVSADKNGAPLPTWRRIFDDCDCVNLSLPKRIRLNEIEGIPDELRIALPADVHVSGLCWTLVLSLLGLSEKSCSPEHVKLRFRRRAEVLLNDGSPLTAVKAIFHNLLRPIERTLLGLISSSHDGMRLSVIVRLVAALDRIPPGGRMPGLPDKERCQIILNDLAPLVGCHDINVEEPLVLAGEPAVEPLYAIDEAWRGYVLNTWMQSDGLQARHGLWLLAREAARQARLFRRFESTNSTFSVRGRDIQTIYTLIGSVDPKDVGQVFPRPPSEAEYSLESLILPPPEEVASPPDPGAVLRFAFFQLYREDLEGRDYRLLTVQNDARTRLGILLAMFTPEAPWLRSGQRQLSPTWATYSHLESAFEPRELVSLLVSLALAAQRLKRYDLLSSAVRLGELKALRGSMYGCSTPSLDRLLAAGPRPPPRGTEPRLKQEIVKSDFLRLVRSEIDVGMLVGGNPDAVLGHLTSTKHPDEVQLRHVISRVERILWTCLPFDDADTVDRDHYLARGKLLVRLGELYHLAGLRGRARRVFNAALDIERRLQQAAPFASSISPVLGGRGTRSLMRFKLDTAIRMSRRAGWAIFKFVDQVSIPEPVPVGHHGDLFREARTLLDQNSRRLTRRPIDAVSNKIDSALLASSEHDFRLALTLLDHASRIQLGSDPTPETLMELPVVRARTYLEATMLCLRCNALGTVFSSHQAVEHLKLYLGMEPECSPLTAGHRLLEHAAESLNTLDRLTSYMRVSWFPLKIDAIYLRGIWRATQSRFIEQNEEYLELMRTALKEIEIAIGKMREIEYGYHLSEAMIVARDLRAAINTASSRLLPAHPPESAGVVSASPEVPTPEKAAPTGANTSMDEVRIRPRAGNRLRVRSNFPTRDGGSEVGARGLI